MRAPPWADGCGAGGAIASHTNTAASEQVGSFAAADSFDAELASRLLRLREDTLRFVGRLMPKPRAPDEAEAPGQITDQSQSKAVH